MIEGAGLEQGRFPRAWAARRHLHQPARRFDNKTQGEAIRDCGLPDGSSLLFDARDPPERVSKAQRCCTHMTYILGPFGLLLPSRVAESRPALGLAAMTNPIASERPSIALAEGVEEAPSRRMGCLARPELAAVNARIASRCI